MDFLFKELYTKLKEFANSEDNIKVDMTFVVFIGPGREDGKRCYFKTKRNSSASDRLFEIWTNCRKIFTNGSKHLRDKPNNVFIQLVAGRFSCCIL